MSPPRNRRNYYRILHVQPEAPVEIIKAAYRALMGPLRCHPDMGGDHATAALINEAYATLSDAEKRAAYDRTLPKGRGRAQAAAPAGAGSAAGPGRMGRFAEAAATVARAAAGAAVPPKATPVHDPRPNPALWRVERCCPFCRAGLPDALRATTRCVRCSAPLSPLPKPDTRRGELFGARSSARIPKKHRIAMIPSPGARPVEVQMRDLSVNGISFFSSMPLPTRQAIRVIDGDIEAVAVVVACRQRDGGCTVHAELLTILMQSGVGVFVSQVA